MLNIDFFFRACLSTLELLKRHGVSRNGADEIEGFFKYVTLYAGGEYPFNIIRSARGVTRNEWKRISLYSTTKFDDIRAEWCFNDVTKLRNNHLLMATIIFGDVVVNPECAENYLEAPRQIYEFTEMCEFGLDFMATMRSILDTFLKEMYQARKSQPERQDRFWAYTTTEEQIVSCVEAQKCGMSVDAAIAIRKLRIERMEKENRKKKTRKRVLCFTTVIVVIVGVIIGFLLCLRKVNPTNGTATDETTKPIATQGASRMPVNTYNGQIIIQTEYEGTCPLTIITDSHTDYYIYLDYQRAPTYSAEGRRLRATVKAPYEGDLAFIVKAGKQVSINVPIGVYKLYYATGSTFYGTAELFGETTTCYAADDELSFYLSGGYYNGHTVTLRETYNGNFDTDRIDERSFPTR